MERRCDCNATVCTQERIAVIKSSAEHYHIYRSYQEAVFWWAIGNRILRINQDISIIVLKATTRLLRNTTKVRETIRVTFIAIICMCPTHKCRIRGQVDYLSNLTNVIWNYEILAMSLTKPGWNSKNCLNKRNSHVDAIKLENKKRSSNRHYQTSVNRYDLINFLRKSMQTFLCTSSNFNWDVNSTRTSSNNEDPFASELLRVSVALGVDHLSLENIHSFYLWVVRHRMFPGKTLEN